MSKKHSGAKALLTAVFGAAAASAAGSVYMNKKFTKKMNEHSNDNNYMHTICFNSQNVEIKPDTDNAYMSCIFGSLNIALNEVPDHDISMDLYSLCGAINITVPVGLNVKFIPTKVEVGTMINNSVDEDVVEDGPTLTITGPILCSVLNISSVQDEDDFEDELDEVAKMEEAPSEVEEEVAEEVAEAEEVVEEAVSETEDTTVEVAEEAVEEVVEEATEEVKEVTEEA